MESIENKKIDTNDLGTNYLKCPDCGHECPLTDATGKTVQEPLCPKCHIVSNKKVKMVEVMPDGTIVGSLDNAPVLSGKDMNALLYLLLQRLGTIEIPQEVFDSAPGPEKIKVEMQWDGTNRIWRFFIKRKPRDRRPKLILPHNRGLVATN